VLIAALTVPALAGCSAKTQGAPEMSLMERYHSGMPLIGGNADNLSNEQEQARAHLSKGMTYAGQERFELAFEQYTRATVLDPQLTEARYRRGLILMENGMPSQALAEFAAVTEQVPDFAPAHEAAGLVYFKSALYVEAEQHLHRALSLDPTLVRAQVHVGVIRNYAKDYDGALGAFHAALRIAPNDGSIYNNIGMTHSMMANDEEAVQAFNMALRMGAPSAKTYNNMGLALARIQRWDEALEAFRCASDEAAAYNNIGYLYFLDGLYPQAIASFERAIELEPQFYVRASENLKRARLAQSFAEHVSPGTAPVRGVAAIPRLFEPGPVSSGPLTQAGGAPGPVLEAAYPIPGAPAKAALRPAAPQLQNLSPLLPVSTTPGRTTSEATPEAMSGILSEDLPEAMSEPAPGTLPNVGGLLPSAQVSHASAAGDLLPLARPVAFTPALTPTRNRPPMTFQAQTVSPRETSAQDSAVGVDLSQYIPGTLPTHPVYTLHVSSWRTPEHAKRDADGLRAKGLTPYILHVTLPEKGEWFRVTIGMYDSLALARENLETQRQDNGFKGLRIVRSQRHLLPEG